MVAQDFLLNGLGGDLLIKNGDFSIGTSDIQAQYDIINDPQGYWKQYPYLGVGLLLQQNGNVNINHLGNLIQQQLRGDGFNTKKPTITINSSGTLDIIPNATRS